jgi:hypothetical protein
MEYELNKKCIEYLNYIEEHKKNVAEIWKCLQKRCKGNYLLDDFTYNIIDELIITHDESKKSGHEFSRYRAKFFPCKTEKTGDLKDSIEENFKYACNFHYNSNPHHWEFWVMVRDVPIKMPLKYVIEMLCDWSAMGLKFGDLPSNFYNKNKPKMILHKHTIILIEYWIRLFDETVLEQLKNREA